MTSVTAQRSTRRRWLLRGCSTLAALIVALALAATWFLGPTLGLALHGKPFFLIKPSPYRYGSFILDFAGTAGINGSSPDYAERATKAKQELKKASRYEETYDILDDALQVAGGGKHSKLIRPEKAQEAAASDVLPTVERRGSSVLITMPAFTGQGAITGESYAHAIADGLSREITAGATGAIIDLRNNTGGDMGPMLAGLSSLLPDGTALDFVHSDDTVTGSVTITGNSVEGGGSATPSPAIGKFHIPVAVLVDEQTASAAEATMLSFRGLPNSRSFGSPTAGYATANVSFAMPDGAYVLLTVAKERDRTGTVFSNEPIQPDEVTNNPLESALTWLTTQS